MDGEEEGETGRRGHALQSATEDDGEQRCITNSAFPTHHPHTAASLYYRRCLLPLSFFLSSSTLTVVSPRVAVVEERNQKRGDFSQ